MLVVIDCCFPVDRTIGPRTGDAWSAALRSTPLGIKLVSLDRLEKWCFMMFHENIWAVFKCVQNPLSLLYTAWLIGISMDCDHPQYIIYIYVCVLGSVPSKIYQNIIINQQGFRTLLISACTNSEESGFASSRTSSNLRPCTASIMAMAETCRYITQNLNSRFGSLLYRFSGALWVDSDFLCSDSYHWPCWLLTKRLRLYQSYQAAETLL